MKYQRNEKTLIRSNNTNSGEAIESWKNVNDNFIENSASDGAFMNNGTYRINR